MPSGVSEKMLTVKAKFQLIHGGDTVRRTVKGYENMYEVDENGNVFSLDRNDGRINRKGKKLKVDINNCGYHRVTLSKLGKVKRVFVHRLVYESFNQAIPGKLQIHHIDENKNNNAIDNLMLATARENNHYSATEKGYKLTQNDVDFIRKTGMGTREVSDTFGIGLRHALRIIKNERWIS